MFAVLIAVTAAVLAACDRSAVPSVSFMVFGDPAELRAYQDVVAAYLEEHPERRVELIHIPGQADYRRRMAVDFASGTPADVMLINYRRAPQLADRNALEPLNDYLRRSTVIRQDDFYPQAMDPFRWDGRLVALPQNLSSLAVYYNRDLFRAAGVPEPGDDWTWDDFLDTARRLTLDADGDGKPEQFGLGIEPSLIRLAPFVWQNGGEVADIPVRPHSLTLVRSASVEAWEWFIELQTVHRVVPNGEEERSEESETRFMNGRLAMYLNSRRGVPTYREIRTFDWDVAPLPRRAKKADILHADGFCIPSSCRHKDLAWSLIEFASSEAGQRILAKSGRTVPSLRRVAESDAFLDPNLPPKRARVFLDAIPTLRAMPLAVHWTDVEEIVGDELANAFYGRRSPQMSLLQAKRRTAEYFEPGHELGEID